MTSGYVEKITTKTGSGRRGPWTAYSALVQTNTGEKNWYSIGFSAPNFVEGEYVEFTEGVNDNGYKTLSGAKTIPKPAAPVPAGTAQSGAQLPANTPVPQGPQTLDARQASIIYQSSRKDAIDFIKLLVANDALPISAAKTPAAKAKRYEEMHALVDKLTVQFWNDVATLRLLDQVEDAGLLENKVDPLPDPAPEAQAETPAKDSW